MGALNVYFSIHNNLETEDMFPCTDKDKHFNPKSHSLFPLFSQDNILFFH